MPLVVMIHECSPGELMVLLSVCSLCIMPTHWESINPIGLSEVFTAVALVHHANKMAAESSDASCPLVVMMYECSSDEELAIAAFMHHTDPT